MTITAIEPQKKKKERFNIFADGEYFASLGAEALVKCGLRTGASITRETLNEAVQQDNARYAFDSAALMLSHSMRTRSEIETRLKEKGLTEEAVLIALDKLVSYGYVDDAAYAKEFVQSALNAQHWGRKVVAYKLKEKGLDRAVIDEAMALYTAEDERRIAHRQLQSVLSRPEADARKQRQKAFAVLSRHGFGYDVISSLLSEADD